MAKLTIILDTRRATSTGEYPIKLSLSNNRTTTTISTGCYSTEKNYVGKIEQVVKSTPLTKVINKQVQQLYINTLMLINELERKYGLSKASASTIKRHIDRALKEDSLTDYTFTHTIEKYASECRTEKTAWGYQYASQLLHAYAHKNKVYFEDITYTYLQSFDKWLTNKKGMSLNTRSIIMRNIRAVFNYAIKCDIIQPTLYPFRKFEIKKAKKEKEHLTIGELKEIIGLELSGALEQARDFFVLSFLLCGINPTDLYSLEKPNKKGMVSFIRKKIAHTEPSPVHLYLHKEATAIVDKYKGQLRMLRFFEKHDYNTFIRRQNRYLKQIGEMIGVNLYMYMARYTWATIADNIGIPHEIISKALGHADSTTAERYYISFNWDRVTKANRQVIDCVYKIV